MKRLLLLKEDVFGLGSNSAPLYSGRPGPLYPMGFAGALGALLLPAGSEILFNLLAARHRALERAVFLLAFIIWQFHGGLSPPRVPEQVASNSDVALFPSHL